ncbi:MAG: hypothetical protein KJ592_01235 [Nanoarchaeota archaeon]|nr:hypothetical protein [Nanoarchaeota archaeon]
MKDFFLLFFFFFLFFLFNEEIYVISPSLFGASALELRFREKSSGFFFRGLRSFRASLQRRVASEALCFRLNWLIE